MVSQCTPLPIFFAAKHIFGMFYILTPPRRCVGALNASVGQWIWT